MSKGNYVEYVKKIETQNSHLENENIRLQRENERILENLDGLRKVNDEFTGCLTIILEKYSTDNYINNLVQKSLKKAADIIIKKNNPTTRK
jgi:hypothetical protein